MFNPCNASSFDNSSEENQQEQTQGVCETEDRPKPHETMFTQRYLVSCASGRVLGDFWFFEKVHSVCDRIKTSSAVYNKIAKELAGGEQMSGVTDDDSHNGFAALAKSLESQDRLLGDLKDDLAAICNEHVNNQWYGPGLNTRRKLTTISAQAAVLGLPTSGDTPYIGEIRCRSGWCPDADALDEHTHPLCEKMVKCMENPFVPDKDRHPYISYPDHEVGIGKGTQMSLYGKDITKTLRDRWGGAKAPFHLELMTEDEIASDETEGEEEEEEIVIEDLFPVPALCALAWAVGQMIATTEQALSDQMDFYDNGCIFAVLTMGLKRPLDELNDLTVEHAEMNGERKRIGGQVWERWQNLNFRASGQFKKRFDQDAKYVL